MKAGGTILVRAARGDDLEPVAAIFLACWQGYVDFLPERIIGVYEADDARALWRRILSSSDPSRTCIVAESVEGDVLGVIAAGIDPDQPATGHVFSLYVGPTARGMGVGARLLAVAIEQFRRQHLVEATLWVFAANTGARRFYSGLGWHSDGSMRVEAEYGEPEVHLRRALDDVDPPLREIHKVTT